MKAKAGEKVPALRSNKVFKLCFPGKGIDVAERTIKLVQVNREVDQISFLNISENYLATKLCACPPPLKIQTFQHFLN